MYQLCWIFFIYAFLGWCTEVSYAALVTGRFVNRGFLNGPVCPIYGFGVLLVVTLLAPLRGNALLLFLGCVVLTSLLELAVGFVLEKLFHQRWWDYSTEPFNLGGYICLRFSLMWGLACLLVVAVIHPGVLWLVAHVPTALGWVLLSILAGAMAVDLTATVRAIAKLNRSLSQIEEAAGKIRTLSDSFGQDLADGVLAAAERGSDWREELEGRVADWREDLEDLRDDLGDWREDLADRAAALGEDLSQLKQRSGKRLAEGRAELEEQLARLEELLGRTDRGQRRLLQAFPRLRSTRYGSAVDRLRRRMDRR